MMESESWFLSDGGVAAVQSPKSSREVLFLTFVTKQ